MRWLNKSVLALVCVLAGALAAHAQSTLVQQSPTMLNACTPMNATAAVNTTVTLTIPAPPSGQYIYICGIDLAVSFNASAAVASTLVSFTSTNLGPAGNTWAWKFSWIGTANTVLAQPFTFTLPIRATNAGTAVTIVSPAIASTTAYSISAYYYVAN